jgi:hypothetical protein
MRKKEQRAVQEFISAVVREIWPRMGLTNEGVATAAWSLYATTMANLSMNVLRSGDKAAIEEHREAIREHCALMLAVAAATSPSAVTAHMNMSSETTQKLGQGWTSTTDVKG